MTLDEAIKHATEVADRYDEIIKTNNHGWGFNGSDENCVRCANEHRQLAEWLIELKEQRQSRGEQPDEPCRYIYRTNGKVMLYSCSHCNYNVAVNTAAEYDLVKGWWRCPNCGRRIAARIELKT